MSGAVDYVVPSARDLTWKGTAGAPGGPRITAPVWLDAAFNAYGYGHRNKRDWYDHMGYKWSRPTMLAYQRGAGLPWPLPDPSSHLLFAIDIATHTLAWAHHRLAEQLGRDPGELIGRNVNEALRPGLEPTPEQRQILARLTNSISTKEARSGSSFMVATSQTEFVHCSGALLPVDITVSRGGLFGILFVIATATGSLHAAPLSASQAVFNVARMPRRIRKEQRLSGSVRWRDLVHYLEAVQPAWVSHG